MTSSLYPPQFDDDDNNNNNNNNIRNVEVALCPYSDAPVLLVCYAGMTVILCALRETCS